MRITDMFGRLSVRRSTVLMVAVAAAAVVITFVLYETSRQPPKPTVYILPSSTITTIPSDTTGSDQPADSKDVVLTADNLTEMRFVSASVGYINVKISPSDDVMLKTSDGGVTWRVVCSFNYTLESFRFVNEQTGYAEAIQPGGSAPFLLRTANGGATWAQLYRSSGFFSPDPVSENVLFAQNTDPATGALRIERSQDGGKSWAAISDPFAGAKGITAMSWVSATEGYLLNSGGTSSSVAVLFYTGDAGTTWRAVFSKSIQDIFGNESGQFTSSGNDASVQSGIRFFGSDGLIRLGNRTFGTDDGGRTMRKRFEQSDALSDFLHRRRVSP